MPRRAAALLALLVAAVLVRPGYGQFANTVFYGKNKITYERFPWKITPTEHFRLYSYIEDPGFLQDIVNMAESAYRKVSRDLKHELPDPVPLIYFRTVTDFEQSNVFQAQEGILGEAEPILFRIGLHGDMPPDELQELIVHELSHIFQFDLLWGNQGGALTAVSQPPLWTFEGLSEYSTGRWSTWSTLIVRDSVLNDRIPEFAENGEMISRFSLPRDPAYDFGHTAYEFMVEKYGPGAVRNLWQSLKAPPLFSRRDPFHRTFGIRAREFSQEFKKYMRARFRDFALRDNPEDYSVTLGPEFPMNPYYFAFSCAPSPSGDLAATITFNALDGDLDVVLLSTKDGRVLRNITAGYTSAYEYIKFDADPSLGAGLAWSPDGDRVVFFARNGRRHDLLIVSVLTGAALDKIHVDIDQPTGPAFAPDGRTVLFAGFQKGRRDLFALDLASGAVRALTNDVLYEKAPCVSPDGRTIAYSVRVGEVDKLFLSPIDDPGKKTQITFGTGNTIDPAFSADGKTLLFAGDERGAFNLYTLDLATGAVRRHSDVRTGNFYPAPLASEPGKALFASFNKGAFQLFKTDLSGPAEGTASFTEAGPEKDWARFTPDLNVPIEKDKTQSYEGLGKLYITARPPVDAMIATDGSVYGGGAVAFSDILGYHQFAIIAYQVQTFRSYSVNYANLRGRLQYGINLSQYSFYYYPNLYYYDPDAFMRLNYNDAIAVRKITGASLAFYYPFSLYVRAEARLGLFRYEEDFLDPTLLSSSGMGSRATFINGTMATARFSLTGETTRFKDYGPASGSTFRLEISQGLPLAANFIQNTMVEADVRKYFYLGDDFLLALRFEGALCRGRDRFLFYYGGNNQVRSSYFYNITGTEYWFANAEFRFPLIARAQTILGTIGPVRGVLLFDVTRAKYGTYPARFYERDASVKDGPTPGYRQAEALGSLGCGIQFVIVGLPVHLEWAKRLEWSDFSNPFAIAAYGAYSLKFWIGLDF